MRLFPPLAKALFLIGLASPASAHEFWIEPLDYSVAVGETMEARLHNGENFKGPIYPYIPQRFTRFEIYDRSGGKPVEGRVGDNPALQVEATKGGLHVAAYASTVNEVVYGEFEKFLNFLSTKKLERIADQHREEGLPEDRVVETYYRYAKALIAVGSGAGRDRAVGMPIELVAELNPYTNGSDGVRLLLLHNGEPLPEWDVQVFQIAPGETEATLTHLTTDKTGRVVVPAGAGGEFLVNAVQIVKPRAADASRNAHWESIWASTTYEIAPE